MTDVLAALIVTEIGALSGTLEERCKTAFSVAADHWMVTDPNKQIQAALAAVLVSYKPDDPERERLEFSCKMTRAINAGTTGIPVDFGQIIDGNEEIDMVPYQKWWTDCGGRTT